MAIYIDMMDFPVEIVDRPVRVISLVPSISLLLSDMGLADRLVGVTKFCVHPKELRSECSIIGGTKLLNIEVIRSLNPDLIIANKEENNKADIELLQNDYAVWISDVNNVNESLQLIKMLGEITKCQENAVLIIERITSERNAYKEIQPPSEIKIAYAIWNKPFMAAARNTFVDSMITEAGWTNAFSEHERYPAFTLEGLKGMQADYLFLSSEPFPFKEKHKQLFNDVIPEDRIFIVDGEVFSWYGSRLIDSYRYFAGLRKKMETTKA